MNDKRPHLEASRRRSQDGMPFESSDGSSGHEPLSTASAIANMLGFSPATIVDWAEAGKIPTFKIGGRLRFRESEVLEWLEKNRVA